MIAGLERIPMRRFVDEGRGPEWQHDPRGAGRTREEADALALEIAKKAATEGQDFKKLMAEYSEDPGSAKSGITYNATPEAGLVPPFKNLSLRLKVGEVGVVETAFGWHIIKREK